MGFFLLLNKKEDIVKKGTRQLTVALTSTVFFFLLWKSVATVNFLVTDILQNIFFCVKQKKETLIQG